MKVLENQKGLNMNFGDFFSFLGKCLVMLSMTSMTSMTASYATREYRERKEQERSLRFKPKEKQAKVETKEKDKMPSEVTINNWFEKISG